MGKIWSWWCQSWKNCFKMFLNCFLLHSVYIVMLNDGGVGRDLPVRGQERRGGLQHPIQVWHQHLHLVRSTRLAYSPPFLPLLRPPPPPPPYSNQYSGSMTFGSGSGSTDSCLWLMDSYSDPDPAFSSLTVETPTKNNLKKKFSAYYFL